MTQRVLTEFVAQYLDEGPGREEEYLDVVGERRGELESLLKIIRLLKAILVPVEPSEAFATALKARLLTMPAEDLPPASPSYATRLVIGAVAFGSLVSAAAVYLIVARARTARAA